MPFNYTLRSPQIQAVCRKNSNRSWTIVSAQCESMVKGYRRTAQRSTHSQ